MYFLKFLLIFFVILFYFIPINAFVLDEIKERGYFNYSYINNLLDRYEKEDDFMVANKIFSLLSLELWLNQYS